MAFVLLVCLVGIAVLAFDVVRRIQEGATASSDSVQWTLSQTDVELLALDVAVHDANNPIEEGHDVQPLVDLRNRFDVFYSRVRLMGVGALFSALSDDVEFAQNYDRLVAFLDECTPIVDGPDDQLIAALPDLHKKITALRPSVRAMALAGLRTYARITENDRAEVGRTLLLVAGLTVVFILTLLALVLLLVRLDRQNRARTHEVESGAARLAAIVATAQDAVVALDPQDRIAGFNAAAERIFGHPAVTALGRDFVAMLAPEADRPAFRKALAEAEAAPGAQDYPRHRLRARHSDGRVFPVELTVSATADTNPRLTVAFLRDLTAEVDAEAALVQARDNARAGERAKADLLAVMSHEVRTPLNGLLGTLELLGHTHLTARQKDYLRILEASGHVLLGHVNDMLDVSRLDAGLMPPVALPLDLGALAQPVFDNQQAAAGARGNRLDLDLSGAGAGGIVSDERLLRQVLLNLVGNAVKFTEAGVITLTVRHLGPEGPTEFVVTDTGIGIAAEDLPRIFDDFVTLDPSYARRQGGTGLGLGIARRIVAQLGGDLAVTSLAGQGTSFRFALSVPILPSPNLPAPNLPAANLPMPDLPMPDHPRPDAAAPVPLPVRQGSGLDVLVIEDNAINRQVLRDMLTREGHDVAEAVDGAEGLRLAAARRFEVILMDISMPRIDGLQALRTLRGGPGPNAGTPVVAVTAHALPAERARFLAQGMAAVLIKPFSGEDLAQALGLALGLALGHSLGQAPAPDPSRTARPDTAAVLPRHHKSHSQVPAALAHLVPAFLAEGTQDIEVIRALALDLNDTEGLQRVVHRLAGSAALIGAGALARQLGRIETALKTGAHQKAREAVAALPALWQRTLQDLQAAQSEEPPARTGTA